MWLWRTGSADRVPGGIAEPYRLLVDGEPLLAARAWTRLGCSYDAAMALAEAPGHVALQDALAILTSLGARSTARIVRQRLQSCGSRSSGPARAALPAD
jgi:hypothetical protein